MKACCRAERYPTDVSDEEWALRAPLPHPPSAAAAPSATTTCARSSTHCAGWSVLALVGGFCPSISHRPAVYQQWRRWQQAGCFEAIVADLRVLLRQAKGRRPEPSAAILDSRTLRSGPEGGARAGYDAHKKTRGSKVHMAVDTLGHLLAALVTPANQQDRDQVAALTRVPGSDLRLLGRGGVCGPGLHRRGAGGGRGLADIPRKWSSSPRPSAASCCCRDDGWWNARTPGWRASGGWPGTTSACQRR